MQLPGKLLKARGHRNLPSEATQAMTQQIFEARQRKLAQGQHARGITLADQLPVVLCKLIKQAGRFGEMARCLGQRGFRRRKALTYRGQGLVAQKISGQRGIRITLVGYPAQAFGRRIAFNFSTGNIKQRAQQTQTTKRALSRHPRRTGHTGPAQQIEQDSFSLITAVLRQQKASTGAFGKCRVTRGTGSSLQAKSG